MATEELDPSGDGSVVTWTPTEATHWQSIDDAVRQPDDPGAETYISTSGPAAHTDEITIEAGALTSITQAVVWVSGKTLGATATVDISFDGGSSYTGSPQGLGLGGSQGWVNLTFAGLDETNSKTIEIKFVQAGLATITLCEAYVVVTGTAAAGQFMRMNKYW